MQEKNEINRSEMDLFGKRLKNLREMLGLKQDELAIKIKQTGYQTISRYERGERYPNKSTLDLLANNLQVSLEYLITGFVNKNYCYEIRETMKLNIVAVDGLAKRILVPERFLVAIISEEISPSAELFNSIMKMMGVKARGNLRDQVEFAIASRHEDTPQFARGPVTSENDRISYLMLRIEKLQKEISEKEEFIDKLFMENERLKIENEQLKNKP